MLADVPQPSGRELSVGINGPDLKREVVDEEQGVHAKDQPHRTACDREILVDHQDQQQAPHHGGFVEQECLIAGVEKALTYFNG